MASLTETAYYARRGINWLILGAIAYMILRIIWSIFVSILIVLFPPKAPPPTHAFGVLPQIKFPQQATPSAKLAFKLETIEGTVPNASESATVYFMPKPSPNLLALTRPQQFAENLNFYQSPIQETKNLFRFNDTDYPLRTLRYDILTNNFTLQYAYGLDTALFNEGTLPTMERAKLEAINVLDSYGVFPADYSKDNLSVGFLKLVGNTLVDTPTVTQANAVRIDLHREDVGGLPVYTPNPDEGAISVVFSSARTDKKRVLAVSYIYWPVDYQTAATYKLKPSSQAWQEIQSGAGYIGKYPTTGSLVVVRSIHLGYMDTVESQAYLQPVFVFEGDNGFIGFVPAVAKPWTE